MAEYRIGLWLYEGENDLRPHLPPQLHTKTGRQGCDEEIEVLVVSATITHAVRHRATYEEALEHFSRPLMARLGTMYSFGKVVTCEGDIRTDSLFTAYEEANLA